jgi:lysophospholipase L1-like esterase
MQLFIFGDSIVYGSHDKVGGWAQRLRLFYEEKMRESKFELYHEVFVLGVPGDRSIHLCERCEQEISARWEAKDQTILLFAVGINDSIVLSQSQKHSVEPDEFRKNILTLSSLGKKYATKTFFVGLTPVDESKVNPIPWFPKGSYLQQERLLYTTILSEVASATDNIFIPIKTLSQKDLEDGVHPNTQGHEKMYVTVKQNIEDYFSQTKKM